MKNLLTFFLLVVIVAPALAAEQPKYTVVADYDDFEVRRYDPYIVAEVVVAGQFSEVGKTAFRILAGYIFGGNGEEMGISMTAPVSQSPVEDVGERNSMKVPGGSTQGSDHQEAFRFTFMMPGTFSLDTLPKPDDARVTLRQMEGTLMAARTYSGNWSEELYRENESALKKAVAKAGLDVRGLPVFARYNSPFMPSFLRKNEVLIEVGEVSPGPAANFHDSLAQRPC